MSKSDKEHYQILQNRAIEELKYEKAEYAKLTQELDELEQNPTVKAYIETKYRWNQQAELSGSAEKRLGLWTFIISQLKDKD